MGIMRITLCCCVFRNWEDPNAAEGASCRPRIFEGTIDARLIALDGHIGSPARDSAQTASWI
jgi:quinoprotein glucose dehydrogenase